MADSTSPSILLVAAPGERRERAAAVLGELEDVTCVDDMRAALEELSFARPPLAVIDGALSDDAIAWIVGALRDPDRALIWVSEIRPPLFECGVFVQIPIACGEKALALAAQRLLDFQRLKLENEQQRHRVERYDHVMRVVSEVRRDIGSPLTSLLAETELMLEDAGQLTEEQRHSLSTMQSMSQRIRELMKRLQDMTLDT
ncbi:MAG: histidine kinase dimerization/phospho-acceptor domain-containing protein [Gemmatimonadota bacterium]